MRPVNWQALLEPGEVLVWQGRPFPAIGLIRPSRTDLIAGAVGTALVVLIFAQRYGTAAEGRVSLLQVLLLLGALLVAGLPFRALRQNRAALLRQAYALTDRRALRLGNQRDPRSLEAAPLPKTPRPVIEPEAFGLATLHFGAGTPRFLHLRDAEAVAKFATMLR